MDPQPSQANSGQAPMGRPSETRQARRPRVWWWFAAAVALHMLAWTCWFGIASRHPVAEVPLAARAGR
jgi:drug/metabolite transporter (DMT)-like permease